ncbi:hypothetical protein H2O73_15540 [Vibrio sp. 404]|uniref:Uncharacterized protein n=1 Tax=Vibrio marinisediminis TaxID=2758441 RepID=A0A7W2IV70_9VIBR|nr:hypothetical protein [Vibrio marinisediminis]MBA5763777.1 hypothetical protein [Vibrio marinisediminis]
MPYRMGLFALSIFIAFCILLAVLKGADDYTNQVYQHRISQMKDTVKKEINEATLREIEPIPFAWTPFPNHEIYGLYYSWLAYYGRDSYDSFNKLNSKSLEEFYLQQVTKPLDSQVVVYKANQMWRSKYSHSDVLEQFHLAQKLGHFERLTLMESLNFYFANWTLLTIRDKKVAVSYLLDHEKYAMKMWQYDSLLKKPVIGERVCAVFSFNDISPYYCR